jgi:hypothetical protein
MVALSSWDLRAIAPMTDDPSSAAPILRKLLSCEEAFVTGVMIAAQLDPA